jgi:P2-related tail formation protein
MGQYRVRFTKRLCNDVGLERNCLQASIDIRRAKSPERALRAAQQRFQRSRRTADWRIYADACEISTSDMLLVRKH